MKSELKFYVVEGDQATANDGERIRAAGAPAVQVNTGTGCHLEADMVMRGLSELRPAAGSIVMIENVGNLVCPALFDLGERAKVVILSVTEGEDKPLKYPVMFRSVDVVLLNKIDLVPHLDVDVDTYIAHVRAVNATEQAHGTRMVVSLRVLSFVRSSCGGVHRDGASGLSSGFSSRE